MTSILLLHNILLMKILFLIVKIHLAQHQDQAK